VEDAPLASAGASRFTTRLRLEPVGPANAADLWRVHNDDEVSYWYGTGKPSPEQAEQQARFMGDSWRFHGVHKWMAYDRLRREYWGRGFASEIGHAGLTFAFGVLEVQAVVSCTAPHNVRSLAVMKRIGMRYAGEIRTRGIVKGADTEQDDAPFAVCVLLRRDWAGP